MNSDKRYEAAELSVDVIDEIQHFETKLRQETNKEVILIAYEKETK